MVVVCRRHHRFAANLSLLSQEARLVAPKRFAEYRRRERQICLWWVQKLLLTLLACAEERPRQVKARRVSVGVVSECAAMYESPVLFVGRVISAVSF